MSESNAALVHVCSRLQSNITFNTQQVAVQDS